MPDVPQKVNKGFLKVAEELYELGKRSKGEKREFAFRSAISRAYYGVLWYVRNFYNLRESEDLHKIVLKTLINKHSDFVVDLLIELKTARVDADYKVKKRKLLKTIDKNVTKLYINIAKSIITYVEKGV
ncbi:hypothetical protein GWK41_06845 [Persephonella atlantica]|uniref:HEPN domain-containing protein n=1 Tax=Persephonella atlantica TaxID=2699429 RepID=A0ABS1GIL8_9AQUI|nr:hypothetical protein [Persephonella atlantica]MBK3332783.1 hypothetical protein [Persephonella atlantica]